MLFMKLSSQSSLRNQDLRNKKSPTIRPGFHYDIGDYAPKLS